MEPPSEGLTIASKSHLRRSSRFAIAAALLCVILWLVVSLTSYPLTQTAATRALEQQSGKSVRIAAFHLTLLPPGCTAENIIFSEPSNSKSQISVSKLVVTASFFDLLLMRRRVERVSVFGLRATLPYKAKGEQKPVPPRFSQIGQLQFSDSILTFPLFPSDPHPLTFTTTNLTLNDLSLSRAGSFSAEISINKPQGQLRVSGEIGPWDWKDMGRTPVSGSFSIARADLASFGGIRGLLGASSRFGGPLNQVSCDGSVTVPDFQVSKSTHSVNLSTTFSALINATNGDVHLAQAESHFNKTIVDSQGFIAYDTAQSREFASLRLSIEQGQVSDVLLPLTRSAQPAMFGVVDLRLNVEAPAGPAPFFGRLMMNGDFGIDRGHFSKPKAQTPINRLGESAEGRKPQQNNTSEAIVLADVAGHISAQQGVVTLAGISFTMPGSRANVSGTYNLLNQAVDLNGRLSTTGALSSTASGLKAMMLKVITPFLKKRSVTSVAFTVKGTAQHPRFALALLKKPHSPQS